MAELVRVSQPDEIPGALKKEYGVRAELNGDPTADDGATLFVWVDPALNKDEIRTRAADLCTDVYAHGFYIVPVVLTGVTPST